MDCTQCEAHNQHQPAAPPRPGRRASKPRGPLGDVWDSYILKRLEATDGELQGAAVAAELKADYPEAFADIKTAALERSLQRWFERWKEDHPSIDSPKKGRSARKRQVPGVVFPQAHPPGREAQVDFTHCSGLGVTIRGEPYYDHQLFSLRLNYSGWYHAEPAEGETVAALHRGIQNAVWALGGVPLVIHRDRSGPAIQNGQPVQAFQDFLDHYGMSTTLINQGCPWENGGAEGANRTVKCRINQGLLLRQSRDFDSVEEYRAFVQRVVDILNAGRGVPERLCQERAALRPLPRDRAPDYTTESLTVPPNIMIKLGHNRYSVPGQAVGSRVDVRLYDDQIQVYLDGGLLDSFPRLHGKGQIRFDFRHVARYLLRKPHAFERYELKGYCFPSDAFREAYARLREWDEGGDARQYEGANRSYLKLLFWASQDDTTEEDVECALTLLLERGSPFDAHDVQALVYPSCGLQGESDPPETPEIADCQLPLL